MKKVDMEEDIDKYDRYEESPEGENLEDGKGGVISRVGRWLVILLSFVIGYIIVGGIIAGQASMLGGAPSFVCLMLLIVIILLIGGLEGLQISVASLTLKDLEESKDECPRAYNLHKKFKMQESKAQSFFSGRQFLIVLLVFVASRLTTFPEMNTLPFVALHIPIPIQIIFLQFGLLGALFVYWLGNLAPQLVATDYPVRFLKLPAMSILFKTCLILDKIQLPSPSRAIANLSTRKWKKPIDIPLSSEQKYKRELEFDSGFTVSSLSKKWKFNDEGVVVLFDAVYEIGREGIVEITDNSFDIPANMEIRRHNGFDSNVRIINGEEGHGGLDLDASKSNNRFIFSIRRVHGGFKKGEKFGLHAKIVGELDLATTPTDEIRLSHPTGELALQLSIDKEIYNSGTPILRIISPTHPNIRSDKAVGFSKRLDLEENGSGEVIAEHHEDFPHQATLYVLQWNLNMRR